MGLDGDM